MRIQTEERKWKYLRENVKNKVIEMKEERKKEW